MKRLTNLFGDIGHGCYKIQGARHQSLPYWASLANTNTITRTDEPWEQMLTSLITK